MPTNPQLAALNLVGQSIWYDNLSAAVLRSGELAKIIQEGVSGLTSNPTIFKKAIADSSDYDDEIRRLAKSDADAEEICEALMVKDVGAAADLLRPIFDRSKGTDGHASIEVSPFLATDTKSTLTAARRLWKQLARPNIMIKVPGTDQGIPAVRALLEEGINVNITLLFSVAMYEKVIDAYIGALEARAKAGLGLAEVSSVASFFVSRVDSICEQELDARAPAKKESFFGKIGIANAKLAYAAYEKAFRSERFQALQAKGALVQRPLWASTGTKHPALRATLYVEELAGRDTVNTVPPATLAAVMKEAKIEPRLHQGAAAAAQLISDLKAAGVPFDQCLVKLQEDGVKSFADSYRELLNSIEKKREAFAA